MSPLNWFFFFIQFSKCVPPRSEMSKTVVEDGVDKLIILLISKIKIKYI